MTPADVGFLTASIVAALLVVGSYGLVVVDTKNHNYWLNFSRSTQIALYPLWVLAAVSFLVYFVSLYLHPSPSDKGVFSWTPHMAQILVLVFLLASALWSFATYGYFNYANSLGWVSSMSLLIVAACIVLLLAGEAEADGKWYKIICLLMLGLVTVLVDAVAWNSRLIRLLLH